MCLDSDIAYTTRGSGRPDIVLPRWQSVTEVRGCYWHGHEGRGHCRRPGKAPGQPPCSVQTALP
ncbi:hypothetical protein ACR03S_19795 (plasmid) [Limimaricola variabilis]